jgi:Nif-specific regulatory protein
VQHSNCELKFTILSGIYGIIGRALHLEHAIEDIIGTLAQSLPISTAAVILKHREFDHFICNVNKESQVDMQRLCRTVQNLVFRVALPFAVLHGDRRPVFLDSKTLRVIRKEQLRILGAPIFLGGAVVGAVVVDRLFGDWATLEEDVEFLSIIANLIAQVATVAVHARRREVALTEEIASLRARLSNKSIAEVCPGTSKRIKKLEEAIRKSAATDASIMLCGEPGSGKAYIAGIIHELSGRMLQPFVTVSCSLPEDILDQELFGGKEALHGEKKTLFEKAKGGSLFVEEVGDLSLPLQAKMVEFIERSGSADFKVTGKRGANIRLIASTSRNLSDAVARGGFRRDLLDMLSVLLIEVPTIRERKEDVPFLIKRFLDEACEEHEKKLRLDTKALNKLCEYEWPGNIAQLRKTIIRLAIMAEGTEIKEEDIASIFRYSYAGEALQAESGGQSTMSRLEEMERQELSTALERNRWIRRKAARELGLTFRQMNYRVKKFGLESLIKENSPRSRKSN